MTQKTVLLAVFLGAIASCTSCATHRPWRHSAPWNFPEAREWNQPLEFSWVNLVDNYRRLAAK
jgi:hypothetical protein